jgi:hypothetical protein
VRGWEGREVESRAWVEKCFAFFNLCIYDIDFTNLCVFGSGI